MRLRKSSTRQYVPFGNQTNLKDVVFVVVVVVVAVIVVVVVVVVVSK